MKTLLFSLAALALAGGVRAEVDRTLPPPPGPAPAASFPDHMQTQVGHGLNVYVVENHRDPTVTFRLLIKAGDSLDGDKPGLSDAMASLLNKGTARRTAAQFADETDFLGASVEAGSAPDALAVSASGLARDLPKLLDLLVDAALHPAFPQEELVKYQRQAISGLAEQKQRPAVVAAKLTGKLLYGAHPYGAYATEESIGAITREDLVQAHARWLPSNATLAIVGDIGGSSGRNLIETLAQVDKAFAEWKNPPSPDAAKPPQFPEFPALPKTLTIHLVDRPGSVQSAVAVARRGLARNNRDVPELGVMNTILGGGFSGRLFQNLRERHGYTYGASSAFAMNRLGGVFSASAEVRNEVTGPAIAEMLAEIKRLRDEPVPEPELAMQRQYVAGNYLLSLESPGRTAERVQEIDLYGLPADYFKTYAKRVSAVNAEAIKSLADKYLGADDATVVVVGEAKEIRPQLEKLGSVIVYDLDLKAAAK